MTRCALIILLSIAAAAADNRDLTQISIQELMSIEVSSVAKKEQTLSSAAAAVYVLTQEEIRRSGATSIPEVLRLVPGLQVARMDFNEWAITARGFNGRFANKMLVLIDGRSVYTPLFSGVYWDVQDTLLEDIDRIEVIRGPGATMWGANAVNGVINILTKKARDTQGALASTGFGSDERGFGAVRYGGRVGKAYYRAYAKFFRRTHDEDEFTPHIDDRWNGLHGGFRTDWELNGADTVTLQGDLYQQHFYTAYEASGQAGLIASKLKSDGANVLARWTHKASTRSESVLQVYYDRTGRVDPYVTAAHRHTLDIDFQHRLQLSERHEMQWGFETRVSRDRFDARPAVRFDPPRRTDYLGAGFVQDDVRLTQALHLIGGAKVEYSSFGHTAVQPSGQIAWTIDPRHTIWASVSRAVRQPSRADQDLRVSSQIFSINGMPVWIQLDGNPSFRPEDALAYEVGTRLQISPRASLDVSGFRDEYRNLRTSENGALVFTRTPTPHFVMPATFANGMSGQSWGWEAAGTWNVLPRWRLSTAYSYLTLHLHRPPASTDSTAELAAGESPRHQGNIRSYLDINRKWSLDAILFLMDRLPAQNVAGYARADAHLTWRPSAPLEISLAAQNIAGRRHLEFVPQTDRVGYGSDEFGRSVYLAVTWRF